MLQIDHVYEFLYQELFKDFDFWYPINGVPKVTDFIDTTDISIFTPYIGVDKKIFFYDQEPYIPQLVNNYIDIFTDLPGKRTIVTSEYSDEISNLAIEINAHLLYYFFHGFAALDWYRGYHALNYNKTIDKNPTHDFVSFNRLITDDRSYRIYFVSLLKEHGLLNQGLVSFGVADDVNLSWQDEVSNPDSKLSNNAKSHITRYLPGTDKLVIDNSYIQGSASADILRTINRVDYNNSPKFDSYWNIVTETVFYYNKLHLTEKIFKPIVNKQPFMLLASPGNLAYLKSYGFKTFDSIIDESYDNISNNDLRTEAVVKQLSWYCGLTNKEKEEIIQTATPIVEYNFQHFYGEFKHIITRELLDNTKNLFKEIGYDDSSIDYKSIYHVLTN